MPKAKQYSDFLSVFFYEAKYVIALCATLICEEQISAIVEMFSC